jgi:hypothetical protein
MTSLSLPWYAIASAQAAARARLTGSTRGQAGFRPTPGTGSAGQPIRRTRPLTTM